MPILEISQLDKAGMVSDINEYLLVPEAFSEAYNVEFSNGSVRSAKGYINYDPEILPEAESWVSCKGIGDKMYLMGSEKSYVLSSNKYFTLDYPEGFVISSEFYINPLSNLPVIISNRTPYGVKMTEEGEVIFKLDGWGNNMSARSVVAYKGYLFAFGMIVNGARYEDTLFWSDIAAPDTYPTDWGFELDDAGNIDLSKPVEHSAGGYNQLSSVGGSFVAAEVFGNSLYVFTENEIFRVTEVGGQLTFRFDKVSTGKGAFSPSSVIAIENGLVVVGNNEMYLFNGQSSQSLTESRISKYLSRKLVSGVDVKIVRDFNEHQLYVFFRDKFEKTSGLTTFYDDDWFWLEDPEGLWIEDYSNTNHYDECLVWDWASNTFSLRDGAYCQFSDMSEFRADALLQYGNKRWFELDIPWSEANFTWVQEVKYGTGVLVIREKQMYILNQGHKITQKDSSTESDVPWLLKRRLYNNAFGYDETGIFRVLKIKLRGSLSEKLQVSVDNSMTTLKGDTAYIRFTGKAIDLTIFGNGQMEIPAYSIDHNLIGRR